MNEINNKLYNTLNHYQNNEPQEVYERVHNKIKDAVITLIAYDVIRDYNEGNALIKTLKVFRPNKTE